MAQSLFDKWLRKEAAQLYPLDPENPEHRRLAVERAGERVMSPEVWEAIRSYNQNLPASPSRDESLLALKEGAVCVVTGQQVGLFLGPLFTLYKTASAIRAAKQLEKESGRRVVPVFWLQSEDHDVAEIASTWTVGKQGELRQLELQVDADNRHSVEHLSLPDGVSALLEEIELVVSELPQADELLELLYRHYVEGAGWVDSFAGVMAELFAEHGLVFVNPRLPQLQKEAAPIYRLALEHSEVLEKALLERSSRIEDFGFKPTVHVRENSPLVFYHPEGREGPRYRLVREGEDYRELGGSGTYKHSFLLKEVEENPLLFSTSALLRPLVQDFLLPTAAYVGGPAEVAYLAQIQTLYEHAGLATEGISEGISGGISAPMVMARARMRVLEGRTLRLLAKLELEADDSRMPEEELLLKCRSQRRKREAREGRQALEDSAGVDVLQELWLPFEQRLKELEDDLKRSGPQLERAVRRTLRSVEVAVSRLSGRYSRALLARDRQLLEDARKLQNLLWPLGVPQERVHSFAWYAARYGVSRFIHSVLAAVEDPFDFRPKDFEP